MEGFEPSTGSFNTYRVTVCSLQPICIHAHHCGGDRIRTYKGFTPDSFQDCLTTNCPLFHYFTQKLIEHLTTLVSQGNCPSGSESGRVFNPSHGGQSCILLKYKGSNLGYLRQRQMCYHYTILQFDRT